MHFRQNSFTHRYLSPSWIRPCRRCRMRGVWSYVGSRSRSPLHKMDWGREGTRAQEEDTIRTCTKTLRRCFHINDQHQIRCLTIGCKSMVFRCSWINWLIRWLLQMIYFSWIISGTNKEHKCLRAVMNHGGFSYNHGFVCDQCLEGTSAKTLISTATMESPLMRVSWAFGASINNYWLLLLLTKLESWLHLLTLDGITFSIIPPFFLYGTFTLGFLKTHISLGLVCTVLITLNMLYLGFNL